MSDDLPVHDAAYRGDREALRAAINTENANARGDYGRTPLTIAAANGDVQMVQDLVDTIKVLSVDAKTFGGCTALMNAAYRGHVDCVKVLLAAGAKENVQGPDSKTALDLAREYAQQEVVALLSGKPGLTQL